jgi:hypothetical protein
MAKISKFVKLDKNVLLEYIYDDGNLLSDSYSILVDSRDRKLSYIAGASSVTNNTLGNQLFKVDSVSQKYAKVNPSYYSFLQLRDFSTGAPTRHDTIKIHLPINWTFGEHLGFYLKVYAFDTNNVKSYELSNFYFDMTDISQSYLLNYTTPPLIFQEKLWGKYISIEVPALSVISSQRENNVPKVNSINANLTEGSGLSMTSPIFIDFQFVDSIQTVSGITSYLVSTRVTTTIPQTPEFEKLGLKIEHSTNGDFFEIYGLYNGSIGGFSNFIDESFNLGHNYYVEYNITMYEQNIRGKTITITQHENFNETNEFRPIIKYTTTTAIIDVEMRLIDKVDDSYIIRRGSYGMLQDEVAKYSLKLMKINLNKANKPKIYNIKNAIDPSLVGLSNSFGKVTTGRVTTKNKNGKSALDINPPVKIETVKVPYPVLVDRNSIITKSENAVYDSKTFYGIGKLLIQIVPFDNVVKFNVANGVPTKPEYLNLSSYGEIKLVFKNDTKVIEIPLYTESGDINLSIGQITFKIPQANFKDIKKIYQSGVNIFYITSYIQNTTSVVYSGLFMIFDNLSNVASLNKAAAVPKIVKDPNLPTETAIVTRVPLKTTTKPTKKP